MRFTGSLCLALASMATLAVGQESAPSLSAQQDLQNLLEAPAPAAAEQVQPKAGNEPVNNIDVLDKLVVRQWARLEQDGLLRGTVITPSGAGELRQIGNARVGLVSQNAEVLQTTSALDGSFVISGARPGTYGLFVLGEGLLASYALHVLPPRQVRAENDSADQFLLVAQPVPRTATGLRVSTGPANIDLLRQSLRSYTPDQSALVSAGPTYRTYTQDPLGDDRRVETFKASLRSDGSLAGRLRFPADTGGNVQEGRLAQLNVMVVNSTEVLGRAEVAATGDFRIPNLSPGLYSMVVAGQSGFAIVGFELTAKGGDVASAGRKSVFRTASFAPGDESEDDFNLEVLPPEMSGPTFDYINNGGAAPGTQGALAGPGGPGAPFGGAGAPSGGMGTGVGGGGGGGGGLGGAGGLAGLAAAAAGIAAAAGGNGNPGAASVGVP